MSSIEKIKTSLSTDRIRTYENAVSNTGNKGNALELYAWNARVSGAILMPLHVCEVVFRNAVAECLERVYGDWTVSTGFKQSLPDYQKTSLAKAITKVIKNTKVGNGAYTKGKIISELEFSFWQSMFHKRNHKRLWDKNLFDLFPNLDRTKPIGELCSEIYLELDDIRKLRNRIAHHEPIFNRNLKNDFEVITRLIKIRCEDTSNWMIENQHVMDVIASR